MTERVETDRWLLLLTLLLCGAGLVMVLSSSQALAVFQHRSPYYYAERQALWLGIGLVALFVLRRVDYRRLRPLALPAAAGAGLLMLLALVPPLGVTVNGARRWFDLGPLGTFQPSELGKLAFALFVADWLDRRDQRLRSLETGFLPFVLLLGAVLAVLMLQRDLGTAFVISCIFVAAYYAGGGRKRYLALLVLGLGVAFVLLSVLEPYRAARLTSFRDPFADRMGAGFQITQSIFALGSGGVFGVGLGHSLEKFLWLPEAHTDFIFAIVGAETGLLGTTLILAGFTAFAVRGYRAAMRAPDRFGVMLGGAIVSWIAFQALVNMATVTATLPITGVPLPLISYGGTAVATTLAAIGVLLNIAGSASTRRTDATPDLGWGDRRSPLPGARSRAGVPR